MLYCSLLLVAVSAAVSVVVVVNVGKPCSENKDTVMIQDASFSIQYYAAVLFYYCELNTIVILCSWMLYSDELCFSHVF